MISVTRYKVEGVNPKVDPKFAKFQNGGILTSDGWINVSKDLPISLFQKGETYNLEIETTAKGYKKVVGIATERVIVPTPTGVQVGSLIPPIPELPKTAVHETPAPGGEPPVRPANNGDKGLGKVLADSEKMTKADWAAKDRSIECQAVLKSVLEAPVLAHLGMGKKTDEVIATIRTLYKEALEMYDEAKKGML